MLSRNEFITSRSASKVAISFLLRKSIHAGISRRPRSERELRAHDEGSLSGRKAYHKKGQTEVEKRFVSETETLLLVAIASRSVENFVKGVKHLDFAQSHENIPNIFLQSVSQFPFLYAILKIERKKKERVS